MLENTSDCWPGWPASATYILVVTISRIPDRKVKNPASRAQIFVNPTSRVAVKSRFPLKYFAFSRIPHRMLVKSWILKIPFQTPFHARWKTKRIHVSFIEHSVSRFFFFFSKKYNSSVALQRASRGNLIYYKKLSFTLLSGTEISLLCGLTKQIVSISEFFCAP